MSEVVVVLGVVETVQGDALKDRLDVRDVNGMGISTFTLVDTSTHLGKGTNIKVSTVCICVSLMS